MSEKVKKEIFEWIKVFALAIVFAFVITQFIKPTLVRGDSMYSTLEEGDYLIINRMSYKFGEPKRGDIIVFESDLQQDDGTNKDLHEGESVSFDIIQADKGPSAINVHKLEG